MTQEIQAVSIEGPQASIAVAEYNGNKKSIDPQPPSTISSMSELKEHYPEMYQLTLEAVAMQVLQNMRSHEHRMKKIMREARIH